MTNPLGIGIAGLGTVGSGVVKIAQRHGDLFAARTGRELRLRAVSARSRHRERNVDISAYDWEDDPVSLCRRDDIDLIVEVMGGEDGPAKAVTEAALGAGKHVVTANKAMLARHGQTLAELAESSGAALKFEAAVAGGIPAVKSLTEGLAGNQITRVMGVLNGTCNYILTEMERTGAAYETVLEDAQRLGYAEADPTFDVGGFDAAQKLALLTATAFGTQVDYDGIWIEGIERVNLADIEHAAELGYRIKLLGIASRLNGQIESRMHPCLVPATSEIGKLEGVTNMVAFEGDAIGRVVLSGPGAGEGPTASAIMADVADIARGFIYPPFGQAAQSLNPHVRAGAFSDACYYLRFLVTDQPGVLGKVALALAAQSISIDRMRQMQHEGNEAPILIVTHETPRNALDAALAEISQLDVCRAEPVAIRIEDM